MTDNFNFTEVMKIKSDSELVEIMTKLRNDYQPDAVKAAETELELRNLSLDQIAQLKSEIEQTQNNKSQKETGKDIENDDSIQRIYSKRTIMAFSVLFTTIFGGVLLMQNHKDIGNKKIANFVLTFSILYTTMSILILSNLEKRNSSLTFLFNIIGGVILTEFFYSKYFSTEHKFKYKRIWKPLIISIIITIPFVLATIIFNE